MLADTAAAQAWLATLPEWDDRAADRLAMLIDMLRDANAEQNLVAAASLDDVWLRHIADSAQLLQFVPPETPGPWLDLGSGAGFPGLVTALLRPECETVLVESRNLRAKWLERVVGALGLTNVRVVAQRLELMPTRPYRVISARAFAPLPKLIKLSARFSTSDTIWLLPKGRSAAQELSELTGWDHMFHVEQSISGADAGLIVGRLAGKKGKKR